MQLSKMCVIWIHGLGDEGRSWTTMKEEIKIPSLSKPILWKFPDAPKAPVTCNQGYQMRSWFDIEDIPITVDAKDYPAGSIHTVP
jgi:predicted esterase